METFVLAQIVRQTNEQTREAVKAMLIGDAKAAFAALDRGGGAVVEQPDATLASSASRRIFAKLSPEDRAGTLVLDPTRDGRQRLTDAIRAERAVSYTPGDIAPFRGTAKGKPRPGVGYRIDSVDAHTGTVRLVPRTCRALLAICR